jgi:hypothetical protein
MYGYDTGVIPLSVRIITEIHEQFPLDLRRATDSQCPPTLFGISTERSPGEEIDTKFESV